MAQAWHRRTPERLTAQMPVWKASEYRHLEAVPSAFWKRIDPFAFYRASASERQKEAGPHAHFLQLRRLWFDRDDLFRKAADVFATTYGLLGVFHHSYSAPILPKGKLYVAPEAVIQSEGRLRLVDPCTEGLELVAKAVNDSRPPAAPRFTRAHYAVVAMPREVRFATRDRFRYPDDPSGRALHNEGYRPWEEVRSAFDALFVLDPPRQAKSSVLSRRESIFIWQSTLEDFPPAPYLEESLPYLSAVLNDWLADTSPEAVVAEHGQLTLGWRCNTLLQAIYLMLFLDLIGGSQLRECASHDCSNYFRVGPQTNSKYCSVRHANRASTRMQRDKRP